jgi:mutator protein MutT
MANSQQETEIAIAIVAQGDRVLIGRRPEGVPLAGYWEFPGGKLLPDESPAAAAVRECREETDLIVTVDEALPVVRHAYPHGQLVLHFFICRVAPDSPAAQAGYRWVERGDLANYQFPPANQAVLRWLINR